MIQTVIAFAGQIKSGKTSLSKEVAAKIGCPRVSFGDEVRAVARVRGLGEDRLSLQDLGQELASQDPQSFCDSVLRQADWRRGRALVIDGLRHTHIRDMLRGLVAPWRLTVIFVDALEATRSRRLNAQTREASGTARYDEHRVESGIAALRTDADLIVDGEGSVSDAVGRIFALVTRA